MAPPALLIPLLLLAAAATIIASQSIISGAFSVTQQAVQLGYLPRIRILHTSDETRGQVFSPSVNLLLLLTVIALVLGFRSSAALAGAFGLAVTATMVLTTLMIGFVIFRIWQWNPVVTVPLYALLLGIEATKVIRADPRFETLPIVAMTANAMAADRDRCLEAGMNDHIAKPIDPDQLFNGLLRWTGERRSVEKTVGHSLGT
jgi:hypothetical protein